MAAVTKIAACLALLAAVGLSCSSTQTVPAAGLEIVIAAEGLSAPADFDDIRLQVSEQVDGGAWSQLWNKDYFVPLEATLPATFAIGTGSSPGEEALVTVTAFNGGPTGTPVVQRVAQVQLPTDRMATLWMVLAKLCEGQVAATGSEGEPVSTCPAGESCQPGNGRCGSNLVDPSDLQTYSPSQDLDSGISMGLVSGDGPAPKMDATMADASDSGTDAADATILDASDAAASDASDASSIVPEPAYLMADAIAGFGYGGSFGAPYDSILAAPMNTSASAIAPGFQTASVGGQLVPSQKFQLVANVADLYSALYVSPALSVVTGLGALSAKTNLAQSNLLDTTDLWVLADVLESSNTQIDNPSLTAQAAAMTPEQFYAHYGDRYASQIVTGAEVLCLLQFPTTSPQDRAQLAAALGFAYGGSVSSATFQTSFTSATAGRTAPQVQCSYVGIAPTSFITDVPSLLNAAQKFQAGTASSLGSITPSMLFTSYTTYYGLTGYPGVPATAAAMVAQEAPLGPDYLLYESLVRNDFNAYYADPAYSGDAGPAFFAHMKAYRDALSTFLSASITDSLNPGVAAPSPSTDGVITDWVITPSVASTGTASPRYTAYGLANGVVPKRLSDYAIPLRYAYPADASGSGTLRGTTFPPVAPVPLASSLTDKGGIDYQLYVVNKGGTTGYWLEYQWDTGTYYFANATSAQGVPSASLIGAQISGFTLSGNLTAQYLVVNKASGLVLTGNDTAGGQSNPVTVTHFASGNRNQLWAFYVDSGGSNCSLYVPPSGTAGMGCAAGNNGPPLAPPPCGSLISAVSEAAIVGHWSGYWSAWGYGTVGPPLYSNGGAGCDDCNWSCGGGACANTNCSGGPEPQGDFFVQAFDNGNTHAIYNFAASPGGIVSYVVTDPAQTIPTNSAAVLLGGNSITGNANQLWAFIPSTNIEPSP